MKLSVIVPIYNVGKYLKDCIESLLSQDYEDYEILLIDDGSKDESTVICDEYAQKSNKVRVIHKENGGAASARNEGIKVSNGEYLFFVDGDDWIETNCLSSMMEIIEEKQLDVLRFNYAREYEGKSIPKNSTILEERLYEGEDDIDLILNKLVGISGQDLAHPENFNFLASSCFNIYRKQIILDNNLIFHNIREYGAFVDGLFNIEYFIHISRFAYINDVCYHYRKTNSGAASANYRREYLPRQLKLFSKIKEILIQNNKYKDESYSNRIALSTMELCLNALRNKSGKKAARYKEVKSILSHPLIHTSLKKLSTKPMSLKWKLYYFGAKHRLTLCTYILTYAIQKLKGRR